MLCSRLEKPEHGGWLFPKFVSVLQGEGERDGIYTGGIETEEEAAGRTR